MQSRTTRAAIHKYLMRLFDLFEDEKFEIPQVSNIISIQGYKPDPSKQKSITVVRKQGKDITVEITPADGTSSYQKHSTSATLSLAHNFG